MRSVLPHRKNQEGQILLIIVLIMVVGLTVGLSLAARSIITLRNTTDEANSQKAYCAATPPQAPSIEIIVISGNRSAPLFSRYAVDPCASRRSSNNFSAPTAGSFTVQNATFPYRVAVTIPALTPGLVARIIPFYQSTPMGISVGNGDPPLPTQENIITATGIAATTQRKIVFYQGFDEIPAEFFYTLFSPK